MLMTHWMAGGAVILCCMATWWDLRTRRIPNGLTIPALVVALCLHGALGAGKGLLLSAAGALAAGALVVPGYLLRYTGAGDVKLLMAVGAFLAFPDALLAGLIALVLGGLMGLASAFRVGRAVQVLSRSLNLGRWLVERAQGLSTQRPAPSGLRVPFGVAIALATVLVVLVPTLGGPR
jgi:prepilin peptidase CpaA